MKIRPLKDRVVIRYSEEQEEKQQAAFTFLMLQKRNHKRARWRRSAPKLRK